MTCIYASRHGVRVSVSACAWVSTNNTFRESNIPKHNFCFFIPAYYSTRICITICIFFFMQVNSVTGLACPTTLAPASSHLRFISTRPYQGKIPHPTLLQITRNIHKCGITPVSIWNWTRQHWDEISRLLIHFWLIWCSAEQADALSCYLLGRVLLPLITCMNQAILGFFVYRTIRDTTIVYQRRNEIRQGVPTSTSRTTLALKLTGCTYYTVYGSKGVLRYC